MFWNKLSNYYCFLINTKLAKYGKVVIWHDSRKTWEDYQDTSATMMLEWTKSGFWLAKHGEIEEEQIQFTMFGAVSLSLFHSNMEIYQTLPAGNVPFKEHKKYRDSTTWEFLVLRLSILYTQEQHILPPAHYWTSISVLTTMDTNVMPMGTHQRLLLFSQQQIKFWGTIMYRHNM